jgi:predicted nucleic acid-binding Zn ribbon protein
MREMTEQQYDALRENRRSARLVALNELTPRARRRQQRTGKCVPTPLAAVVTEAAESLRRRQLAAAAWARVVPPAWAGETAVTDVHRLHKDTVTITASSSALLCELRRRQPALEQGLARLAPGVRHIRFVVGDPPP